MAAIFHVRRIILLFSLCVTVHVKAQTPFNQSNFGYWSGYTTTIPNQLVSTFDPVPGICGFSASQFHVNDANKSPTGAANGFNSHQYISATLEAAVLDGDYMWFDIIAVTDTVYLDSVVLLLRKSATGPASVNLSYATSTSGSATYTSLTTVTGLPAGSTSDFDLTSTAPLIIAPGNTFRFRMTSWGATGASGTVRVKNDSYISGHTGMHNDVADTARHILTATTRDSVVLCMGSDYDVTISSNGIGDSVFYRTIGTTTASAYGIINASGIFLLPFSATEEGYTSIIIDSSKKAGNCFDPIIFSDTLVIRVNPPITTDISETICLGDTVYWDGIPYYEEGVYTHLYTTPLNCDSIVSLNLTVLHPAFADIDTAVSLCAGVTFNWGPYTIDTSGAYVQVHTGANGCDSTTTLNVNFVVLGIASVDGYDFIPSIFSNPHEFQFSPINPVGVTTYLWDFGDGTSSTEVDPVHLFPSKGNYDVLLTVTNACGTTSVTQNINVVDELSSEDLEMEGKLKVYPVPASDYITVETSGGLVLNKIAVYNINGQLIQSEYPESTVMIHTIRFRSLPKGNYLLLMEDKERNSIVKKIAVQ